MDSPHGSRALVVLALLAGFAAASAPAIAGCLPDNIPDDGYIGIGDAGDGTGADAGMLCCSEDVSTVVPGVIRDVNLSLQITHSYVGDLVVKIKSPSSTISTVLSRPGLAEGSDVGAGDAGWSADWSASSIRFDEQSSGPSAEALGEGLLDAEAVCIADGICAFQPAHDSGPGNRLDSDFDGQTYVGPWEVCVGDAAQPDAFAPVWNSYILELVLDRSMPCVCNGKFRGGDRVKFAPFTGPVASADLNANSDQRIPIPPAAGSSGEVMCGNDGKFPFIAVAWEGFAGGHNTDCSCPTGSMPNGTTSVWNVDCAELLPDLPWSDDFETGDTNHWSFDQGVL